MAVLKEFRCAAHTAFESTEPICPACKHDKFVTQEIRTAPAFRRGNMAFIDNTLRDIAQDAGLTDLKNDPKAGVSVLEAMKKTNDLTAPRWGSVPHAAPGFSQTKDASVPTVTAESMGFVPTPAAKIRLPPQGHDGHFNNALARTKVYGSYKGG
jgi:hypothetical protein